MKLTIRAIILIGALLLQACALAPSKERPHSEAVPYSEIAQSQLFQSIQLLSEENNNLTGIYAITDALEAYSSRVLLVRTAEKTLDVQYYIWRNDNTGLLLLYELYLAAERGVRVRLLLDDLGSYGIDDWLAMLDAHPNVEVRLFNPFSSRVVRTLDFLTNFSRANRRMHNKSITADTAMTIVGGRNIGDEYFAATEGVLFADLDVLAVGPAAQAVANDFDRYWHSPSAYAVSQLFKQNTSSEVLLGSLNGVFQHPNALLYLVALQNTSFTRQFYQQQLPFEWVDVRLVSDNPAKGEGKEKESDLLLYQLLPMLDEHEAQSVYLVSPYFVPTRKGAKYFYELSKQGVDIQILTNSLAATDVAVVHSGYMKHRKKLLRSGIDLYEIKNFAVESELEGKDKQRIFGSSSTSLHAKTFAINQRKVFVGSFNFDPRSARLNTELGFVIDSPSMAAKIERVFSEKLHSSAYKLQITPQGKLQWYEQGTPFKVHTKEPESTWLKRTLVRMLSWLPLDPLL